MSLSFPETIVTGDGCRSRCAALLVKNTQQGRMSSSHRNTNGNGRCFQASLNSCRPDLFYSK